MKFLVSLLVLAIVAFQINAQSGIAIMKGTTANPGLTGYVTFTVNSANSSLVDVFVNVTGITVNPDAEHGVHVHQWGDISLMNGSSVASHFNPLNAPHSCPPTDARHLGDMGNWNVSGGVLIQTKTLDLLTLTGSNSIIGRGVIIHSGVDDCNVTTSSGSRLGQGVVGIANVTNNTAVQGASDVYKAICVLAPISDAPAGSDSISGYAVITQGANDEAPVVFVALSGVDSKVHAIHIHQTGDISTMASVGAHWAASGDTIHGVYGWPHHHTGDLGNVYFFDPSSNNVAYFNQTGNPSFGLTGRTSQPNFIGHALVVHASRDNCSSPAGNSGSRIASCVFGYTDLAFNSSLSPVYLPSVTVPTAYDAQTQGDCNYTFASDLASTGSLTGLTTATTGGSSASTFAYSAVLVVVSIMIAMF